MEADPVVLLDTFDRFVASASALAPATARSAAAVARRARSRLGYLGRSVVVALAGGTGSGKTSLLNALAGAEIGEASSRRPTTGVPLAWVPADPEPGLERLLDDLGVVSRVTQCRAPWLTVIDLPDTDSVERSHRATVERILELVDAVVWVVDVEKYGDAVLHHRYLAPLRAHGERFVFVLNQIDRLAPGDLPLVVDDLAAALTADGVGEPRILAVAADPALGPPLGVELLLGFLEEELEAKRLVLHKLGVDLRAAAASLADAAGLEAARRVGARWPLLLDELTPSLLAAASVSPAGKPVEAPAAAEAFLEEAAAEIGGEAGARLRALAASVLVEQGGIVRSVVEAVPVAEPTPGPPRLQALLLAEALAAGAGAVLPATRGATAVGLGTVALVSVGGFGLSARARVRRRRQLQAAAEVQAKERRAVELRRLLDVRLGGSVRSALRRHAEAAARQAELAVLLAGWGS